MSDKLEKYIKAHKDQFEEDFREDKVWQNIKKSTVPTASTRRLRTDFYWKAAAIVLLLLSVGLLFDKYVVDERQTEVADNYKETINEFEEVEGYYMSLIEEKRQALNVKLDEEPSLENEFSKELNELDSAYAQLKTNLDDGNTENVVDALILNLQLRIDILNRQLMILEQLKNKEDETVI